MLKALIDYIPIPAIVCAVIIFILLPFDQSQATQQPVTRLDAVVVSATKTEKSAFKVPDSVSVVDTESIEHRLATDVGQILDGLPNIEITAGPRAVGEDINIRGLSNERILFLVDGARRNFSPAHQGRFFIEPELLKQVEVLRGPGSALWGSGALGGVISFTTKDASDLLKPDQTFGAYVKAGYQDVDSGALLSGSIYGHNQNNFEYLINLSARDTDDLETGGGEIIEHSAFESLASLTKLSWNLTANQRLSAALQTYNQQGETLPNPSADQSETNPLVDRETQQQDITLQYRFNNTNNPWFDLTANIYQTNTEITEDRISGGPRNDVTEFSTTGFEVRNHSKIGEQHLLTYGLDYYIDQNEARRDGAERPSFPDGESSVYGVYLQDEIKLGQRWTLIPGLRHDQFESSSDSDIAEDQDESESSAKLGISYQATSWLSLHAAYGEAFRAPKVTELFVSGTHFGGGPFTNDFIPNPNLKPEKAANKEIGARLAWNNLKDNDALRIKLSVFENDVEDFIDTEVCVTQFPGDLFTCGGLGGQLGFTTNTNISDAELTGYEFELVYQWSLYAFNAAYGQTRGEDSETGADLNDIPADKWVFDFAVKSANEQFRVSFRASLVDDQNRVSGVTPTTAGYDLLDIYATWQPVGSNWQNLRLDFGIDNVTDEKYRRHLATLDEAGRNLKISLAYRF